MSKKKIGVDYSSPKLLTAVETPKGTWADLVMGVFSKTPESMTLLEIYAIMKELQRTSVKTTQEQIKLKYCLYSILSIILITSAILSVVFYAFLNMQAIGLSFLGPVLTGIIGLIVVFVSGRK